MPLTQQWSSLPDAEYDSKQGISLLESTAILSIWETGPLRSYPYCKMSAIVEATQDHGKTRNAIAPATRAFRGSLHKIHVGNRSNTHSLQLKLLHRSSVAAAMEDRAPLSVHAKEFCVE